MQADSIISDTSGFIIWPMATRRETQFLKVFANHTMLTVGGDIGLRF